RLLKRGGMPVDSPFAEWIIGELERGNPADIAEAGREIGRFDSRIWIGAVRAPIDVVCTTKDRLVPPANQREIEALVPGARLFEVPGDHTAVGDNAGLFVAALLSA